MGYRFYRYITQTAAGDLKLEIPSTKKLYLFNGATNISEISYSGGNTTVTGPSLTGNDYIIKANQVDTYPTTVWEGNTNILNKIPTAGVFNINVNGDSYLNIDGNTYANHVTIRARYTNSDLIFQPNGTGNIRFGVYAATGDVACNGYITIKDEAGNTRKLMTTA